MGLAPLDVWARLLVACGGGIGPRYWLRLGAALGTSVLATAVTLPERLVLGPWLWWRFGRRGGAARLKPRRDVIVIVGYFRSGTTHLHNLLATHPDVVTPRWVQAMSPQGFWLSWALLRLALVPFLPNTRPQDEVAFGPDWPAEDDFACNNWALASGLPGRLVVPSRRGAWARFDLLAGLTEGEAARWRRAAAAFAWKVGLASPGRALLLKSPSHTAKVSELDRLFGGRVRFVHISRDAEAVVRSNVAMHARLEGQSLGPLTGPEALRRQVVGEYVEAERRCAEALDALGEGRSVRLRYEAVVERPMEAFERICRVASLRWDDRVRARALRYLAEVGEHAPRRHEAHGATEPELAELDSMLRSRAEPVPRAGGEERPGHPAPARRVRGMVAAPLAAGVGVLLWLWLAGRSGERLDLLAWPLGGAVGVAALRAAGRGGAGLGLWAAGWALAMVLAVVWPLPEVAHGWTGPDRLNNLRTSYGTFNNNYVYALLGLLTAYRYASRRFARPPGV
jgi:omega-hydroxy-beta-dihydromenaquinone-9 sulfotransferase